jgi:hypothetical protein
MLGLSDAEQDHVDDMTALMEDAATGYGHKRTHSRKSDGTEYQGRMALSCTESASADYAKAQVGVNTFGKSWFRWKGLVTDWERSDSTRTLSRRELDRITDEDREKIKARVLAKMGFTLSDWDRLNDAPCQDKGLVAKFDAAVYKVKESGGRINDLARCLGLTLKPRTGKQRGTGASSCARLQDCIKRHRQRLAHPEDFGVTTCAASRCSNQFYRQSPSQLYCSSPCQQSERNRRIRERKRLKRAAQAVP